MSVERRSADQFYVFSSDDSVTPEMCAEQDFRIRSGMCPNGCGLMELDSEYPGQRCPKCNFWCNSLPENQPAN